MVDGVAECAEVSGVQRVSKVGGHVRADAVVAIWQGPREQHICGEEGEGEEGGRGEDDLKGTKVSVFITRGKMEEYHYCYRLVIIQ